MFICEIVSESSTCYIECVPKKWTIVESNNYRSELDYLYTIKNLTIFEVAKKLGIKFQTVYDRLVRFKIKINPILKANCARKRRSDISIPKMYSPDIAEFFGIMLGDGNLSKFQVCVTLGSKEDGYVKYVALLMKNIFKVNVHCCVRKGGYKDVYLGSRELVDWFMSEGLVYNKVKEQINIPKWIFNNTDYMKRFVKGFFDTDGSVYKIKFGVQISFCNYSKPILNSLHSILKRLKYSPSSISGHNVYLTKKEDIQRFFKEIEPSNVKHIRRYKGILKSINKI